MSDPRAGRVRRETEVGFFYGPRVCGKEVRNGNQEKAQSPGAVCMFPDVLKKHKGWWVFISVSIMSLLLVVGSFDLCIIPLTFAAEKVEGWLLAIIIRGVLFYFRGMGC